MVEAKSQSGRLLEDALRVEFDEMFERMQRPGSRQESDALFRATPQALGKAAVTAARKNAPSRSRA